MAKIKWEYAVFKLEGLRNLSDSNKLTKWKTCKDKIASIARTFDRAGTPVVVGKRKKK